LISVEIETSCEHREHCGQALQFTLDSAMRFSVGESGAVPLMFSPEVDWENFTGRSIIDSY
jgi:hypothetical protein